MQMAIGFIAVAVCVGIVYAWERFDLKNRQDEIAATAVALMGLIALFVAA